MPSAAAVRLQIETGLARRIPSALTPRPHTIRPCAPTGIESVDELLHGGLPLGALSELTGPECSGRTSLALSFLARLTKEGRVCAWIDVTDALDPSSAAAAGVDLARLLWVRCGVTAGATRHAAESSFTLPEKCLVPPPTQHGLHGGGFGPHPRTEVKGLSAAVSGLLRPETIAPRCAEPQRRATIAKGSVTPFVQPRVASLPANRPAPAKPWLRMEQALRAADLLLQAGGFAALVLDMAGIAPDCAMRVPMATWFRYRAAAERTQATFLLLTQAPCAKSSTELLLRFEPGTSQNDEATVFTGIEHRVELERRRFTETPAHTIPMRKPPQRQTGASWRSRTTWAGAR
ncbi:MAG TPA: ATPase domain-containing protein [Terracidiphilus sp.]|nr:ATPase domain-containing protein [Terracidiphilus sp.]